MTVNVFVSPSRSMMADCESDMDVTINSGWGSMTLSAIVDAIGP